VSAAGLEERLRGGEVRTVDPETGGEKGSKPERFDLIPPEALEELARVFGFGGRKYEDHNYLKGFKWSLSIAAHDRHMAAWRRGETDDAESGLSHLMHAAWHLFALYMFQRHGLGTDDRWFPPVADESHHWGPGEIERVLGIMREVESRRGSYVWGAGHQPRDYSATVGAFLPDADEDDEVHTRALDEECERIIPSAEDADYWRRKREADERAELGEGYKPGWTV
jgi:hypothetical protein